MNRISLAAALAALSTLASTAFAFEVTVNDNGTAADVVNAAFDPFYVTETAVSGGGQYVIQNNTTNLHLIGFGVTNGSPAAIATIFDNDCCGFIGQSDGATYNFWEAFELTEDNWGSPLVWADYYGEQTSASALFGAAGDVLSDDEPIAMYFQISDASISAAGISAWGFGFQNSVPASSLFGVAMDDQGGTYAFIGGAANPGAPAVPLPAPALLLLSGLGGLALRARRKA